MHAKVIIHSLLYLHTCTCACRGQGIAYHQLPLWRIKWPSRCVRLQQLRTMQDLELSTLLVVVVSTPKVLVDPLQNTTVTTSAIAIICQQPHRYKCIAAFHVYRNHPATNPAGDVGSSTLGLASAEVKCNYYWKGCGPNFCCCFLPFNHQQPCT